MSLRDRILARLEVSEDDIADSLARVIKGERITRVMKPDTSPDASPGTMRCVEEQITISPSDAARGLMIYDALHGGSLGITPQISAIKTPEQRMYAAFAPKYDGRIVATKKAPVLIVQDEPVDPIEPTVDSVMDPDPIPRGNF